VSPQEPQVDITLLEQTRKQINRIVEQIAQLSETDMAPSDYYGEFLQRVLTAVAAPAGAVWVRTPQGHLQLQYQVNLRQVGLDRSETDRQTHDELLRLAAQLGRPQLVPPHSGTGTSEEGKPAPGNPTGYVILLAPILVDKQVAGLVEVWQDPDRNPNAQQGFLHFVTRMAELASAYTRNHQLRQMIGQQTLWTQLEQFARQIHGSLNPMEVGYHIANEGRRLIDCDRLSVALRMGRKARVEAVSGADVVERRSNLVRLMSKLFDAVLAWGEKLIYQGTKDDSLPPDVLKALDAYLAESNSKLLIVLPLKDERESESKKPPRSALLMECFDPAAAPEQLIARLDVVGRHATSALYNAAEHRRIPMRFIWQPLAKVQDGLGGKARAITLSVIAGLALLILLMVFVPYPLKMDAKGQLLPKDRRYIYAPVEGRVVRFEVNPGQNVEKDDPLVYMYDPQLATKMITLQSDMAAAKAEADAIQFELNRGANLTPQERQQKSAELKAKQNTARFKDEELSEICKRVNGERSKPGYFLIQSPIRGTVLNGSFKEELTDQTVKPNQPILRVGDKSENSGWEIELKIPQKHIGQVLAAVDPADRDKPLDVDLILRSAPTQTYRGKLVRTSIGGEATPNRDDNNEAEPVVLAYVRIDGKDIDPDRDLMARRDLLVTGTEVVAKVRCGNHAMGYSLFYGVWEFFYEKVVFFF
jgi:multidrug efflux pump subunit AcrA (membrane-fusion protein)